MTTEQLSLFDEPDEETKAKEKRTDYFKEEEVVKAILEHWPHFASLEDVVAARITPAMAMAQFNALCAGAGGNEGYWISALFNPHRISTTKGSPASWWEGLSKPKVRRIMALHFARYRNGGDFHPGMWASMCGYGFGGLTSADEFKPSFARDIYREFCKSEPYDVLDPCHGWGGRLIGWAATGIKGTYTGVDPATKTAAGVQKLAEFLKVSERVKLVCEPFEDVELGDKLFDVALTSPPYFDTENYSDEPTQSFRRFTTFPEWRKGFLRPLIENTLAHLKPNAPFVINVGNAKHDLTHHIKFVLGMGDNKNIIMQHLYDYRIGRPLEHGGETVEDFLILRKKA